MNLNPGTISSGLNAGVFTANSTASFTVGMFDYVAINNGVAGFNQATDSIIRINSLTDTLSASNFSMI